MRDLPKCWKCGKWHPYPSSFCWQFDLVQPTNMVNVAMHETAQHQKDRKILSTLYRIWKAKDDKAQVEVLSHRLAKILYSQSQKRSSTKQ